MFAFLLAPANTPFAVALALMFAIALLEGASTLLGQGLSQLLEGFMPGVDADVDVDMDADIVASGSIDGEPIGSESALSRLFGWLHVGRVPVLILLVLFLSSFGLAGYMVQGILHNATGLLLPASFASLPAGVVAVGAVRVLGGIFGRLMPSDETSAVSAETFIGRIAVVIRGVAKRGHPAEAKLVDEHGATHYFLVEPDNDEDEFAVGEDLLIVARHGAVFRAIFNTSSAMRDQS